MYILESRIITCRCLIGLVSAMLVFGDLPARCDILIFKYIVSESSYLSVSVLCISLLMLLENITSLEYLGALGVEI